MTAVSLAVAAIPKGFRPFQRLSSPLAFSDLVKRNAIIRTLPVCGNAGQLHGHCFPIRQEPLPKQNDGVEAYVNHKRDQINRTAPATVLNDEEKRLLSISVLMR